MAWQLIYTSAPRTLTAGQTGYGTVARSMDLRDALIQRLEQLSYFQHGDNRVTTPPVIHAYRILDLRGAKYHVLTRLVDAGLDFTNRTNHLAHHLIFTPEELAAKPSPALIFLHWSGWRNTWTDEPRFLDSGDWLSFDDLPRAATLPAESWSRLTGDAGRAAALLTRPAANGCQLACEAGHESEWLALFAESLQLLDPEKKSPAQRWTFPFTTHLQEQDQPNDFRWRGGEPNSPTALRANDLPVPSGELAELARRGPKKPVIAPVAPRVGVAPVVSAKPVVAKPDNSTRYRLASPSTAARIDNDEPTDEPRRSSGVRWMIPTVVTLLVVAVLIIWPGKKKGGRKPADSVSTSQAGDMTKSDVSKEVRLIDSFADVPPPKNNGEAGRPSPAFDQPPTPEALAEVTNKLDGIRTHFVFKNATETIPLPKMPELETLLTNMFVGNSRLALGRISVQADHARLHFTASANPPLPLVSNYRDLRAKDDSGAEFNFNAVRSMSEPGQPVMVATPEIKRCAALLFKPASAAPDAFPEFRILFLGTPLPEPITLPKSLLRGNRMTHDDTFVPLLKDRLAVFNLGAGFRFQLRPGIGTNFSDLFDQMGAEFQLNSEGIPLLALSNRLTGAINMARNREAALQGQMQSLEAEIQSDKQKDVPLGQPFGHSDGPLSELAKFAETHKPNRLAVNQSTFLKYLMELSRTGPLKEKSHEEFQKLLKDKKIRDEESKKLHELLKNSGGDVSKLDPDYFSRRWKELAKVEELETRRANLTKLRAEIVSLEKRCALVPADLATTPLVRLWVVDAEGRRRLELIRFVDPKKP